MNREAWLSALTEELAQAFEQAGHPLPDDVSLSCGFTSKGAKSKVIGECHYVLQAEEGWRNEIFIRPDLHEPMDVAATVLHELCHAALGPGFGHGKEFRKLATGLGLTGHMKSTVAGDPAKALLEPILARLGPYPHQRLDCAPLTRAATTSGKVHRNLNCPDCGFHAKVWLHQMDMGRLNCPADGSMLLMKCEEIDGGDDD